MLIKEVVQNYKGRAQFVSENWGDSKLAEYFGVKKYPVVFVDGILVAKPDDFGWRGEKGKYTPWREPANHEKFKKDLTRMIDLSLRDRTELARKHQVQLNEEADIALLPKFTIADLKGEQVASSNLAGQVVVVEFWATWCPPCRATLGWLGEIERRYGDKVKVLAVAVDSQEAEVREMVKSLNLPVQFILGSDNLAASFGNPTSVPTMFIFDREGKTASILYGAPKDLHRKVGRIIDTLVK